MKKFIGVLWLSAIGITFFGCDSTTSPRSLLDDPPGVSNLSVSPTNISFSEDADGFKDTTVTLQLQFDVQNLETTDVLQYNISTKAKDRLGGETKEEGTLEIERTGSFSTSQTIQFKTSTTNVWDHVINIFVNDSSGYGNYAQTEFRVDGFSSAPPQILFAENETEIQRPKAGSEDAIFKAKVTDADGDSTIYGVFFRLITSSGAEDPNSPYELFDDGQTKTSGDKTEGDSVYTIKFPINSNSDAPPASFDILYFAIDKAGMVSDTIKTTFSITE